MSTEPGNAIDRIRDEFERRNTVPTPNEAVPLISVSLADTKELLDQLATKDREIKELRGQRNHFEAQMNDKSGVIHALRSMLRVAGFPERTKEGEDEHGNEIFWPVRVEKQLEACIADRDQLRAEVERLTKYEQLYCEEEAMRRNANRTNEQLRAQLDQQTKAHAATMEIVLRRAETAEAQLAEAQEDSKRLACAILGLDSDVQIGQDAVALAHACAARGGAR